MLKCSKCQERKDESEFYKSSYSKTWYKSCCKDCNRKCYGEKNKARSKRNYYKNLEENRRKSRERRRQNPEVRKQNYREWAEKNKEYNILRRTYYMLRRRCNNPLDIKYPIYWWRGIKCERETLKDFINDMWESFYEHIAEHWTWRKNCQLDRIDNDWNYCKENCRWVTAKQNNPYNHAREFNSITT